MDFYYINNVSKTHLGNEDVSKQDIDTIKNTIIAFYAKFGYSVNENFDKIYIQKSGTLYPFECSLLSQDNCSIILSNVIAPNNAYEYSRESGIVYYINTSEKPHLNYPHVHARYAEDIISVSLIDFCVEGKFKTKNKQKEALKFIKEHQSDLMKIWNKVITT